MIYPNIPTNFIPFQIYYSKPTNSQENQILSKNCFLSRTFAPDFSKKKVTRETL